MPLRQFCVILTREGRLRFKFLHLEHGLLHDKQDKKTYAVISDAMPTNWAGRWSRAYLIHETSAQTIKLATGEEHELHGGTVRVLDPLNMIAKIRMPGPRGDDGQVRDVHLTAESIYDRTLAVQVRRLGNRRINWVQGLLLVGFGFFLAVILMTAFAFLNAAGGEAPDSTPPPNIVLPPSGAPGPQSGPIEEPVIRVGPTPIPAQPDQGPP